MGSFQGREAKMVGNRCLNVRKPVGSHIVYADVLLGYSPSLTGSLIATKKPVDTDVFYA